jgi:hypothetical protein
MPKVSFGITETKRELGNLPGLPVVNMFAEAAPTEETGVTLQSRPPLGDRAANMGAGPVDCLFKGDGVLDSGLYGVSNTSFYNGTTLIGAVDGAGPFSMAGYDTNLFAAGGASLWGFDGVTLGAVAVPDNQNVTKVLVGASRAIILTAEKEQLYWSDVLSTNIDALSFSTAESQPDRLKDALFWSDSLLLFGAETVETHTNSPDPLLPFQALEGRTFRRGIKATGCATLFGPTYAWVTDKNQVCLETPETIISDPGLEEIIAASTNVRLFSFHIEGTEFLGLRLDTETHCYSYRSRTWGQFASNGETNWLAQCFAGDVFGSAIDGRTFEWTTGWEDLGGEMERRFGGGFPLNSGGVTVDSFSLRTNPGNTTYLSGDYVNPTVEARFSRNAGRTWNAWRQTSLGVQGDYRKQPRWPACGMFGQPGFMFEVRVTDPVDFRVSGAFVNEPYGGV